MPSAQNIPSIEAGSNTAVADYNMEQVDTQEYENSPWSMVDVAPDLAHMGDDQIFNNCLEFQGFDYSTTIGNTDQDSLSCSGLAASTSIGQSSLTVSSSECYPSSHNTGECIQADNHLWDAARMESYPTPVSNPSHTPKAANRVLKGKRRKVTKGKATREDRNVPASTIPALARRNPSPSNKANSVQLDLLRCLTSRARLVSDDETLLTIHEVGVQILSDTYAILNDWSEWVPRELQPALLPPYRSLSTLEICVAASRILMEPKSGSHSIHRRLAQLLLYIFVSIFVKELEEREKNGETFDRKGRKVITMAHDMIVECVGSDLKMWNRGRVVDNKNYGKRWLRLGSGIGIITVLTCPPDSVIGDM
ncbi:hypothetical protein EIK77_000826 [Talaromyces pinophilus]|nr:hypothetical protein EIK77_000826 [Talaromyces pinophilus]PCG88396.1 Hypothetical protein PENO1_110470 [Penicillium occitanis (nom. inval.)]PCG88488.1 hypothetical protein PENOC_110740 [Penicillium occitanis (nom. inval.)]